MNLDGAIKNDMLMLHLIEEMTPNIDEWRKKFM